jgi:hypothetical protein
MNGVIGYSDDNKNEEKEEGDEQEESDSESDIVYEKARDYNIDETNSESNLKPSSSGNSLEEKILGTVSEHLNYEGIMFSDIPETTVLEGDTTSVEENETQKLNVVKRTLNTEN